VLAIIRSVFPTRELGKAFGWYGAMAGVSTAAGPLLGGLLIAADPGGLDWRPIFLINVPVGVFTRSFWSSRWCPRCADAAATWTPSASR